jgi:hypothetical protein
MTHLSARQCSTPPRPSGRMAVARWWWRTLALVVAVALVGEFIAYMTRADIQHRPVGVRLLRFASYFTIQSNLLVLITTLPLARNPQHDGPTWRIGRLDGLLGISVTGLVFGLVLSATYHPQGLGWWTNLGLHYVSPTLTVLGFILLGPRGRIPWNVIGRAMLWPGCWILWTLLHGAATGFYPYAFLNVATLGYVSALINMGVVVLLAFGLLLLFRTLDRWMLRWERRAS